jgi:hypothetical protein
VKLGGVRKAMRGIDAAFHLAALIGIPYSYDAPDSYVRTNALHHRVGQDALDVAGGAARQPVGPSGSLCAVVFAVLR